MSKKSISASVSEDLLERLDALADVLIAKERLHEERLSPSEMRKKLGV